MDQDIEALLSRLAAVARLVPERGRPFFEEVVDGVEVTGLRARHGWQVYGALVLLRESRLRHDEALRVEAEQWLADAMATTTEAIDVVHRREQGYRYEPLSRSIAGGPEGTEDRNWTIYGYRYLNRTHHGYYYTRIDGLAVEAFSGVDDAAPVVVSDALLAPGEALEVQVVVPAVTGVSVDWGDGDSETGGPAFEHEYGEPGFFTVELEGALGLGPFSFEASVASLAREHRTGFSGVVVEPAGAAIIESVLPSLVFGPADGEAVAIGFGTDDGHAVDPSHWSRAVAAAGSSALFESSPADLTVPIVTRSTGEVMTTISVRDAVLRLDDELSPAVLTGQLSTDAVVDAVVAVGGFDEEGARDLVAVMLGYTAETLPPAVSFEARYAVLDE
jgi:hypothetical protein